MKRISADRVREIEDITLSLLEEVYPDEFSVPVPIDKIAKNYGLSIEVVPDFEGLEKEKGEPVSGSFNRDQKKISVLQGESYGRKAFSVAHELGHYFLHKDKKEEVLLRTDALAVGHDHDPMETEANVFAANLLMPRFLVEKYWKKTNDIRVLSTLFGVSQVAMRYRLMNLGLLHDE